MDLVRKKR